MTYDKHDVAYLAAVLATEPGMDKATTPNVAFGAASDAVILYRLASAAHARAERTANGDQDPRQAARDRKMENAHMRRVSFILREYGATLMHFGGLGGDKLAIKLASGRRRGVDDLWRL